MSAGISATGRFAAPQLLNLGAPPRLASRPIADLMADTKPRLIAALGAIGIVYDTVGLESSTPMALTGVAIYRDVLRRQAIDDAVTQTFLGSATGAMLDQRAADYGVLRRSLPHTIPEPAPDNRPAGVPPAWTYDATAALWRENDESLRLQARLAWEALSVAGPRGAYAYHARAAHPEVSDAAVYGPESGYVQPGEVLVVVQASTGNTVPRREVLDAVAARLDAHEVVDSFGARTIRAVRDEQSVRPLGARVIINAVEPVPYSVEATLYVRPGTDAAAIRAAASVRALAYADVCLKTGRPVTRAGLITALSLAGADGLPTVDDINLTVPVADVVPNYKQIAALTRSPTLAVEIR